MRVISGAFGGRTLHAPRGRTTRPTSDRVRESLFMWLGPLTGVRVVDLYAGSGALGIEALSRGASFVDFVEQDRPALEALRRNLETLELQAMSKVWPLHLPRGLKRLPGPLVAAGVVLADPPYGGREAGELLTVLGRPGVLATGARLILESHAKDDCPEAAGELALEDERQWGETMVRAYRSRAGTPDRGGA